MEIGYHYEKQAHQALTYLVGVMVRVRVRVRVKDRMGVSVIVVVTLYVDIPSW